MKKNILNIKGTKDILPNETLVWRYLSEYIHEFFRQHGYKEIINPIFEDTSLFNRSIGKETDIVSKEMYSWTDQGNNNLTLRPEFTASVVRSYIQHQLGKQNALHKLYYLGDAFRRERPQKGRFRQFRQFGIEALGSNFPEQDAEIISIAYKLYHSLKIQNLQLKINSIGSKESRILYKSDLKSYLEKYKSDLTETSRYRLKTNPLRILDTKVDFEKEIIADAPVILDYLNSEDKEHFSYVKDFLKQLNIPYEIDNKLVRGLDYYSKTVFEIHHGSLGGQNALCGGGRYDYLVEELGGPSTPAIGFAAGFERLLMAVDSSSFGINSDADIYIISLGKNAIGYSLDLAAKLRSNSNFIVVTDMLQKTMKSQMKDANRMNCKYMLIIGDDEISKNIIQVKNMETGNQESVDLSNLIKYFS